MKRFLSGSRSVDAVARLTSGLLLLLLLPVILLAARLPGIDRLSPEAAPRPDRKPT